MVIEFKFGKQELTKGSSNEWFGGPSEFGDRIAVGMSNKDRTSWLRNRIITLAFTLIITVTFRASAKQ